MMRTWSLSVALVCGALGTPFLAHATCTSQTPPAVPAQAQAVGYNTNTFSSTDFTSGTGGNVDLTYAYGGPCLQWFPYHNIPIGPTDADMSQVQPQPDGSLLLMGDTTGPGGEIATAAPRPDQSGHFVGTAFGGGAYIEARIKFDVKDNYASGSDWPAFWSGSIERYAQWMVGTAPNQVPSDQWVNEPAQGNPAQPYEHFVEADFMEYFGSTNINPSPGTNPTWGYSGHFHDWYGTRLTTCPGYLFCDGFNNLDTTTQGNLDTKTVPSGTDFSQYHNYGFLWVPATATTKGYTQYYFDGQPIGITNYNYTWYQWVDGPLGPPNYQGTSAPMFGVIDQQHLILILGTGLGSTTTKGEPMTIASVNVWQAGTSKNLTNASAQAPACSYSITTPAVPTLPAPPNPTTLSFSAFGYLGASFTINVSGGCPWAPTVGQAPTASSDAQWISFANPVSTTSNGTMSFTYNVLPNQYFTARTGHIRVANQLLTINQAGL